jgi:anti-sigma factor RsiW
MNKRRESDRPGTETPRAPQPARPARRGRRRLAHRPSAVIGCVAAHEAISSLVDGEWPPIAEAVTRDHLAGCPECREFEAKVISLRRQMSVRALAPAPDRTTEILASLGLADHTIAPQRAGTRLRGYPARDLWLRATQWGAGLVPLLIAVPALALGAFTHPHLVGSHVLTPCTSYLLHHHRGR